MVWELRSTHPILDVRFFANPRFSGASLAITLVFFSLFGSIFFLTQYLQFVLGYGTLRGRAGHRSGGAGAHGGGARSRPSSPSASARRPSWRPACSIVSAALVMLSTATVDSGYGIVLAVIVTMGVGMGLAMAPATDSIMGSLPKAKAGVGSAVNDTTREVGGALGVAILGSLLAAGYHSSMDASAAVQALPAAGGRRRPRLPRWRRPRGRPARRRRVSRCVADATRAFVDAMSSTVLVAAAVAVVGALVALIWLPSRAPEPVEEPRTAVDAAVLDDELALVVGLRVPGHRRSTRHHGEVADLVASLTHRPDGVGRAAPRPTSPSSTPPSRSS